MTAADKEIITRYEDLSMSVDEIAGDLELESDAVRLSLTQHSATYRSMIRHGSAENGGESRVFNDLIATRAAKVMEQLLDSDEDQVRFRAARFVIDEHKGRNDAAIRGLKAAQQLGVSVLQINEAIKKARLMRLRTQELRNANANATDISSVSVTDKAEQRKANETLELVLAK